MCPSRLNVGQKGGCCKKIKFATLFSCIEFALQRISFGSKLSATPMRLCSTQCVALVQSFSSFLFCHFLMLNFWLSIFESSLSWRLSLSGKASLDWLITFVYFCIFCYLFVYFPTYLSIAERSADIRKPGYSSMKMPSSKSGFRIRSSRICVQTIYWYISNIWRLSSPDKCYFRLRPAGSRAVLLQERRRVRVCKSESRSLV